jgi:protein-S-isoprenylcysteine O-methyltransferase Ste14
VGLALRAEERRGHFTTRWGVEEGFRRFRRVAALIMNNDGVSFVVLCLVSARTLPADVPRAWLLVPGAVMVVGGAATKLWARAALGVRAYYWYDFFAPPSSSPARSAGGPYRFLANPMYTVGYLPLYGLALVTLSLPGLVAAVFDHAAILAFYHAVERAHFHRLFQAGGASRVITASNQQADTTPAGR